ncbi:large conductance mechanosensitive channel protein MscL [Nocardia sp. NPDC051030]|uniref:large conductance mechanosensitive channel protein MscL n=1 Tax=Nocardia sp. NPDC051030 TaxID=3155162 RepID=UPI003439BFED
MLKGFKGFLMRGNVIDLAVAVVMGTAFTAIVTSVTKGLIEPLLATIGGNSEFGFGVQLMADKPSTFIALGPIITAIINFATVAAVLYFVLIHPMSILKSRMIKPEKVKADPTELELLAEIRDLLAKQNSNASEAAFGAHGATGLHRGYTPEPPANPQGQYPEPSRNLRG